MKIICMALRSKEQHLFSQVFRRGCGDRLHAEIRAIQQSSTYPELNQYTIVPLPFNKVCLVCYSTDILAKMITEVENILHTYSGTPITNVFQKHKTP